MCIFFHLQYEAVKRGKKAQEEVRERPGAAAQARPGPGAGRNHNGGRGLHIFWAPDPGLPTTLWGLSCHYLLCTEERPGSSGGQVACFRSHRVSVTEPWDSNPDVSGEGAVPLKWCSSGQRSLSIRHDKAGTSLPKHVSCRLARTETDSSLHFLSHSPVPGAGPMHIRSN